MSVGGGAPMAEAESRSQPWRPTGGGTARLRRGRAAGPAADERPRSAVRGVYVIAVSWGREVVHAFYENGIQVLRDLGCAAVDLWVLRPASGRPTSTPTRGGVRTAERNSTTSWSVSSWTRSRSVAGGELRARPSRRSLPTFVTCCCVGTNRDLHFTVLRRPGALAPPPCGTACDLATHVGWYGAAHRCWLRVRVDGGRVGRV